MTRRLYGLAMTACMLCGLTMFAPLSQKAFADEGNGNGLKGSYAFQFNGTVFVGSADFDGPFARNGRVVFDGKGNFATTQVTVNYKGNVGHETFSGTYVLNSDGTFTLTIPNLSVPFLPPGTPNIFTFEGVLGDQGKTAKVALSGVSIFGQPLPNIGSVITGELVRQ